MTAPDRPTPEVRDEWVEAAAVAAVDGALGAQFDWVGTGSSNYTREDQLREAREWMLEPLAALVPLIEADVGERIAAAIRDIAAKPILHGDHEWKRGAVDGLERAAVVAENGGDRIARAVATGDEGGM